MRIKSNWLDKVEINGNQMFPKLKHLYISENAISILAIKNHDHIETLYAINNPFDEVKIINLKNLSSLSFGG